MNQGKQNGIKQPRDPPQVHNLVGETDTTNIKFGVVLTEIIVRFVYFAMEQSLAAFFPPGTIRSVSHIGLLVYRC